MNIKYRNLVLLVAVFVLFPYVSRADWNWNDLVRPDAWRKWAQQYIQKAGKGLMDYGASTSEDAKTNDEPEEVFIELDEKKVAADTFHSNPDFYDNLGIKFFPEQYLVGGEPTFRKYLNTLFEAKKNRQAVAYFISLERKNHAAAISILESMAPEQRLIILLDSPAVFIAKILVQMRKFDFKGKTLSHWGPYELHSQYFGRKAVSNAEIKGESVSLRYLMFLLTYNAKTQEEFGSRAFSLAKILGHVTGNDLSSLLVYSREEVIVKLGEKHESCFGAVKTKGYCGEETAIYLPESFVGSLLSFMHDQKMISKKDIVNVLEAEFKINSERFNRILKAIDIKVIQDVAFNFSEEIIALLPDEAILEAMPDNDDDHILNRIDDGKDGRNVINISKIDSKIKIDEQEEL